MSDTDDRLKLLEAEIERRLVERFAALRDEFDRLRLESDRRWAGFLDRFDQKFTGIVPPELVLAPPELASAPTPAPAPGRFSIDDARKLDEAPNQVEVLQRFLGACLHHASRVALIVSRGGGVSVWKALGFSDHGGDDEAARRATLSAGTGLSGVLEGQGGLLDSGNPISAALGASDASRAVLIPMVVKEKISGAVYADCVPGGESRFDPDALAIATFVAGLVVDRLAQRKLVPAPALRALEIAAATPSAEPSLELAPEPEEAAPRASDFKTQMMPAAEPGAARPSPAEAPDSISVDAPASAPSPSWTGEPSPAAADQSGPFGRPTGSGVGTSPGAMGLEPSAAEKPSAPPPVPRPSSGVVRPSTGARRLAGPLAPVETGDERREEARRFAKLLVSEIKLYNEKQVQAGRQQGNLYELLKEDIDRSRQMYDERIPEDVRASSNFFYEELVRILADGRAESLGI
ncbi:MAG TPA: hypothetical protein VJA66_15030 [Thermoanaerobaculia bacterium]